MYSAYVAKLKNIRPHPNADRLNLAECFGNTVVVSKDYDEETLYIYFPEGGRLSEEYATKNDLLRRKDAEGKPAGGYLDPYKRNITAVRLRGEKSDGLVMPLESVAYTGVDVSTFQEGIVIHMLNGHLICEKYVPRRNPGRSSGNGNRTRKKKVDVAPLFAEHADTQQLQYNLSAFRPGDQIEISLKIHGSSQRTGYLPVLKGYKRTFWDWLFRREGQPIYDYGYISGTRRTVLNDYEGGYYGSNAFREKHSKIFEGKLQKGESVYYEVCGFTDDGTPIMASANNKKTKDEAFIQQYGETTVFSYGCDPTGKKRMYGRDEDGTYALDVEVPKSDMYVYRMTLTTEEGHIVEYTPDYMRYRCEQMGVKCVPVFWKGFIPDENEYKRKRQDLVEGNIVYNTLTEGEWVKYIAEQYYDGPDPIGKTHVREGVVVRIVNRPKFTAYKYKNYNFKLLSGIAIADAEATGKTDNMDEDILSEM